MPMDKFSSNFWVSVSMLVHRSDSVKIVALALEVLIFCIPFLK